VDEFSTIASSPDLLDHASSLRTLARRLVADEADAQDLIQETWLEALRRPPEGVERMRGWLVVVLRRKWSRTLRRRRARREREKIAIKAGGPADRADLVLDELQRRSLRRALEGMIESLPAKQAHAIRLHYFEGLSIQEIALGQGVADSTVRTWLHRGIERLRLRLDESHGGDRQRWVGSLLVGFGLRPRRVPVAPPLGSKLAAVSGLVLVAGVLSAVLTRETPRAEAANTPMRAVATNADSDGARPAPSAVRLAVGASPPGHAPGSNAPSQAEPDALRSLRLSFETRGEPVAGAAIWVSEPDSTDRGSVVAHTDEDGAVQLDGVSGRSWIRPHWDGLHGRQVLVESLHGEGVHRFDIRPSTHIEGVVLDPHDRPSPGALVRLSGTENHGQPYLDPQGRVWLSRAIQEVTTDLEGRYRLGKPCSSWLRILAVTAEGACNVRTVPRMGKTTTELILRTKAPATALGVIVSPSGRPLSGARIELVPPPLFPERETRTDGEGRFRLERLPAGPRTLRISAPGELGATRTLRFPVGRSVEVGTIELERGAPGDPGAPGEPTFGELSRLATRGTASLTLRFPSTELRLGVESGMVLLHERWRRYSQDWKPRTQDEIRFDHLPAGSYELLLETIPFAHVQRRIDLREGEQSFFDVPLHEGAPQLISLEAPRALAAGETLEMMLVGSGESGSILLPFERTATIRADAVLRRLVPGHYRIEVRTSAGLEGALSFEVDDFERTQRVVALR
jgi:RNA polymerase sigma-70 factor (ECF subfamily)